MRSAPRSVEDQPIDAFEDPAAQTLSSVIGGDREDRRVVRAKRPARRSQRALQRQLEPDRRAVTGNGQDTDPPRVLREFAEDGLVEIEPRLVGVVEAPRSLDHGQEGAEVQIVDRGDLEELAAVGALIETSKHRGFAL